MILIISSKIAGVDHAARLLCETLTKDKQEYCFINPHDLVSSHCVLKQEGAKIELIVSNRVVVPHIIYIATNWRCDSIIRLPASVDYPAAFRAKVQQFMQDIRFAFEQTTWIPGKYESIEKADSKPTMLREASLAGLSTPSFTTNSFSIPPDSEKIGLFRKNLGFPFLVSLSKKKGSEVAITTTNTPYNPVLHLDDGQPWQWQAPIKTVAQVRSYVVGHKIWSVCWKKTSDQTNTQDYRQLNQVEKMKIVWKPYVLPSDLTNSIFILMRRLNLMVASPEFLVSENGNHVFIDLNPCGDWFGFFDEIINKEIISSLSGFFSLVL